MESAKIKVLYIDDEKNNLISFKANFREFYEIFIAESAEIGKKILSENDIHVLLTDQKMPGQSGVQFLESIIKEFPFTIKIMITGYADMEIVVDAINKGQIYKYVLKPFDIDELKTVIDNAYNLWLLRKSGATASKKYNHLFENYKDIVFITDEKFYLKELNSFGSNLLKIEMNALSTVNLEAIFNNEKEYTAFSHQLVNNASIIDYPAKLKDCRNAIIEGLVSATPIIEKEKITGYQCIIRDITKQKEISNLVIKAVIDAQEKERIRFGRNLHDSIGQKLSSIKLFLNELEKGHESLKQNEMLMKSKEVIDFTITELKSICFNIMPKTLEVIGLRGAIKEFIRQNEAPGVLKLDFKMDEKFPRMDLHLELAIFRIVQEFVNNSFKHGEAQQVDLVFEYENNTIQIKLSDNGKGFVVNDEKSIKGNGISNIRSRVQSYNGQVMINSAIQKGTIFDIVIPVNKNLLFSPAP